MQLHTLVRSWTLQNHSGKYSDWLFFKIASLYLDLLLYATYGRQQLIAKEGILWYPFQSRRRFDQHRHRHRLLKMPLALAAARQTELF